MTLRFVPSTAARPVGACVDRQGELPSTAMPFVVEFVAPEEWAWQKSWTSPVSASAAHGRVQPLCLHGGRKVRRPLEGARKPEWSVVVVVKPVFGGASNDRVAAASAWALLQ